MKKIFITAIMLIISLVTIIPDDAIFCAVNAKVQNTQINNQVTLDIQSKSALLMDADSGTIIYEKNKDEKVAPASTTKIVTMLVALKAIDSGKINLEDDVIISEYAASQEGSECFLDAGKSYKVKDLLKSIAVASANDSSVAIAEYVSGSEQVFVQEMNNLAKSLQMNNTNFVNSTGLDIDNHYTTAGDLAIAIKELYKYPLIAEFEKTWMYDMQHSAGRVTGLTNTNRLIRTNKDICVSKTGHTDNAGYCLVTLAKRGDTKLIACVLNANDSKTRFESIQQMLDYGFANYQSITLYKAYEPLGSIDVNQGKQNKVNYAPIQDVIIFTKKGAEPVYNKNVKLNQKELKAPVQKLQTIGNLVITQNDTTIEYPLKTISSVEEKSYKDYIVELVS